MDTRYRTLLEDINNLAGRSDFDLNHIITSLNKYHDEEMTISKNDSEGYDLTLKASGEVISFDKQGNILSENIPAGYEKVADSLSGVFSGKPRNDASLLKGEKIKKKAPYKQKSKTPYKPKTQSHMPSQKEADKVQHEAEAQNKKQEEIKDRQWQERVAKQKKAESKKDKISLFNIISAPFRLLLYPFKMLVIGITHLFGSMKSSVAPVKQEVFSEKQKKSHYLKEDKAPVKGKVKEAPSKDKSRDITASFDTFMEQYHGLDAVKMYDFLDNLQNDRVLIKPVDFVKCLSYALKDMKVSHDTKTDTFIIEDEKNKLVFDRRGNIKEKASAVVDKDFEKVVAMVQRYPSLVKPSQTEKAILAAKFSKIPNPFNLSLKEAMDNQLINLDISKGIENTEFRYDYHKLEAFVKSRDGEISPALKDIFDKHRDDTFRVETRRERTDKASIEFFTKNAEEMNVDELRKFRDDFSSKENKEQYINIIDTQLKKRYEAEKSNVEKPANKEEVPNEYFDSTIADEVLGDAGVSVSEEKEENEPVKQEDIEER